MRTRLERWFYRLFYAHPKWSSLLTAPNVLAAAAIALLIATVPPSSPESAIAGMFGMIMMGVSTAVITMRDIYVYTEARKLVADEKAFDEAIHDFWFINWLYVHSDRHEATAMDYEKAAVSDDSDQRLRLAMLYTQYLLARRRPHARIRALVRGAGLFCVAILAPLMPARLATLRDQLRQIP